MKRFFKQYFALIIGSVAIIMIAGVWAFFTYNDLKTAVENDLTDLVQLVSAAVSSENLAALSYTESDIGDPKYQEIYAQFISVGQAMGRHIKGIYVIKILGGEARFVVDSALPDDPYHSEPGTVYEQVPQAVFDVSRDGIRRFVGPYTDEYGSYYSAFTAISLEAEGSTLIMGADVETGVFNALLRERLQLPALIFLVALLLYMILNFFLAERLNLQEAAREQERRALRNAQERELLLLNISEGVVACDDSGTVTYANRFARETVCAPGIECVGKPFQQYWAIVDEQGVPLPDAQQPLSVASAKQDPVAAAPQRYIRRIDGSLLPVVVSVASIGEKPGKRTIVMSYRDMTREAEIDRMKTDFVSIAVHQLKTPLTSLKWAVEMLAGETKKRSKDGEDAVNMISEVTGHLNELVTSLLNITRIESGRMSVVPEPTDLGEMVQGVVKELDLRIKEKKLEVSVAVESGLPKIAVDPRLIREVYKNFLTNAVKYTPAGGKVDVAIARKGGEVVSSVKDNGYGIPKDEQKRLFDKFFRASNVQGLSEEGTGLGLYFARQIVEVSGGRIWFQSAEGKGTTFFFSLPLPGSPAKKGEIRIS